MKKNIFSLFLTTIIIFTLFSTNVLAANIVTTINGDVDGDNVISAADARLALRMSVGLEKINNIADMDENNKITAADARIILRISVGLENETGYDPTIDNPYYNVGSSYDPNRAGLIYDIHEIITSYDKLKEGDIYFAYDKNGYLEKKQVPYSNPEDDPGPMRCEYCGKEMQTFNGEHFGCYYGYCERWFFDMNCPECNEFILANTCHTCKK